MRTTAQPARPEVLAPAPWAFPVPTQTATPNGIRVLAYHVPGQYVVAVRVVVPLSLGTEPEDREGIAVMTARLLDEGTARHSPDQFAFLLERSGIAFGAGASEGSLGVDLDVPRRFLAPALDLLRQALTEPAFPEAEVRRLVRSRLAEIEQERASGPYRAARELVATMYAADDRASRPTGGSPATVSGISRNDVVRFHAQRLGPTGATVVVAGDLTGLDPGALVEEALGGWVAPEHVPAPAPHPPVAAPDAARVVVVDRPGSVQSDLSVACPGPDRRIPQGWAPHPVLSFVIGGSPGARIDAVLREEKGYTYGIRSAFRPRVRGGSFVTSGSVRADTTAESLRIALDLLDGARDGFTDEEARAAVDFVSRTAPGRYATADAIADESAALAAEDLPLDFPTTTMSGVARLDAAALTAAYRRVVDGRWSVVVVGDAAGCVPAIEAAGLGPVAVVPL